MPSLTILSVLISRLPSLSFLYCYLSSIILNATFLLYPALLYRLHRQITVLDCPSQSLSLFHHPYLYFTVLLNFPLSLFCRPYFSFTVLISHSHSFLYKLSLYFTILSYLLPSSSLFDCPHLSLTFLISLFPSLSPFYRSYIHHILHIFIIVYLL